MKQVAIAIDQLFNSLFGGFADETLSARCWREGRHSMEWEALRNAIDTLLWFDKQHCFQSYISEYERKQLPEEYR